MSHLTHKINVIRDRIYSKIDKSERIEYHINSEPSVFTVKCGNKDIKPIIDSILNDSIGIKVCSSHSDEHLFYQITIS